MMLTKVENTFWLILLPLKTERRGIIAKFQILLLPTVRTGHIKTHEMCRLVSGFFDLAGPLILGVEPRMDFGHTEPSIRLSPAGLANPLFQHPVRTRKARHNKPHPRIFTVVFAAAPQTPETHTGGKTLQGERIIAVFSSEPWSQLQQCRNIPYRWLNMRFHKIFSS